MKKDISLMLPIFGSHVKRIGWLRTLVGGFSMYLCIPILVLSYLTMSVIFYQRLIRPIFGTREVRWADHVIIDRHRIEDIPAFDKFNCMFCGYANGLCTIANTEIDQIAELNTENLSLTKYIALIGMFLLIMPVGIIYELNYQIIYNLLVSRPLGMHRVSIKEAASILATGQYASAFPALPKYFLHQAKNAALRFTMALEQIESSWCPLKHFERREGIVYPDHHEKFFGPDQIQEMREVLSTTGTVSDRRPMY